MDLEPFKVLLEAQNKSFKTASDVIVEQLKSSIQHFEETITDLVKSFEFKQVNVKQLQSEGYLKCNEIRWIPLHLIQRNTVPVLAESASHQFDSSQNLRKGPVAVHAASANNLFVLKCRGRDRSDLQHYSRPRGSFRTQPMTKQHIINMAEPHVITRGIKAPAAVHSSVSLPGFSSLG
ncbi:hypothetical protein Pcinc_011511 [Petrolisthes cinctipes]|uniref:Uncharacterized protein n=1 Tax=Petrolisthes cinctipes TaxID=88211 RepID=A0AAE1G175_PETCI|nr:hypothetical protein Pcinc_011511 [Petrolisthes cinctipes]